MKKILVAPVPVTPTKPLSPSHLKGVLWVDILSKATSKIANVACHYSWLVSNSSEQTVAFWEFLDRCHGDIDFGDLTEEQIGEYYLRYHAETTKPSKRAVLPYLEASEKSNWVHPVSQRLNEIWSSQFAMLGVQQFLLQPRPFALSVDELIIRLAENGLCIDLRAQGGSVYLDVTDEGIPLRQVITREGRSNYLVSFLRELVPLVLNYDHIVLVHDHELDADYFLLQRILSRLGADVCREPITRVPIDGVVQSARHGGWQGYTASSLIALWQRLEMDAACLQLGVRFHLIGVLGKTRKLSFNLLDFERNMRRARRSLAAASTGNDTLEIENFLKACTVRKTFVDPYRLTCALMSRRSGAPYPKPGADGWYI